jgi:hypothetical protein
MIAGIALVIAGVASHRPACESARGGTPYKVSKQDDRRPRDGQRVGADRA